MAIDAQLFTVERFETFLSETIAADARYGLVHGTVVEKPMPTEEHGLLVARLVMLVLQFLEKHKLGRVVVETAYHRPDDTLNRRIPDVSFTSNERLLPLTTKGAVPQMPDLIEHVSACLIGL